MERAEANGAVTVPGGADQVAARSASSPAAAASTRAFDFVGVDADHRGSPRASMAQRGRLTVVGIAGGTTDLDRSSPTPYESTLTNTYWGTIEDLHEVVDMYRAGQIRPDVQRFPMDRRAGGLPRRWSPARSAVERS